MKKFIIIMILLISNFSYYGAVNDKGEKVPYVESLVQEEKIVQEECVEEIKTTIDEIDNKNIQESKEISQKQTTQVSVVKETDVNIPTETKKLNADTKIKKAQEKQETKVEEIPETKVETKQETKAEGIENNVIEKQVTEIDIVEKTEETPKCTHSQDGYYNSKAEAEEIYYAKIKKWGDMWINNEIQDDEVYYRNCPDGYDVLECPYCHKWKLSLFY